MKVRAIALLGIDLHCVPTCMPGTDVYYSSTAKQSDDKDDDASELASSKDLDRASNALFPPLCIYCDLWERYSV